MSDEDGRALRAAIALGTLLPSSQHLGAQSLLFTAYTAPTFALESVLTLGTHTTPLRRQPPNGLLPFWPTPIPAKRAFGRIRTRKILCLAATTPHEATRAQQSTMVDTTQQPTHLDTHAVQVTVVLHLSYPTRGREQRLRWDATPVHARTAHVLARENRRPQPCKNVRTEISTGLSPVTAHNGCRSVPLVDCWSINQW